jgi:transcriptional regulator with XRE-family HTH domain
MTYRQPELVQTPEQFGAVLRSERRARDLTQQEAAALAGVSVRLWNETERGKRLQLGLDTALRMLQTLGLDLAIVSRSAQGNASR